MWQAGADHDQRGALLADLVAGAAQRRELGGGDVLHLVAAPPDPDAVAPGAVGEVGEQLHQVELEVAGVGAALGGGYVDRRGPPDALAVLERGAQRERLEHAGHRVDAVGVAVPVRHVADRGVHGLRQRQPQRLLGARLDLAGPPRPLHRLGAQRVEQHGLADAAQAGEHHGALGAARGDAFERHLELRELPVATGQLGRALAGAGGVGVPDGVHARNLSALLADSLDFASES